VIRLSAKAGKERGKAKKDADPKAEEELPRATIHDDVDDSLDHIRRDHSQGTNRTRKQCPLLLFLRNIHPLPIAKCHPGYVFFYQTKYEPHLDRPCVTEIRCG
jgi:hypothetical protein